MSEDVFVLDAVRTPIGRHGGALAAVRPDDLAAGVIAGLVERSPSLDPSAIGDVVFGDGNAAGEDNRNVARMALLLAGVPPSVPAPPSTGLRVGARGRDQREPRDRRWRPLHLHRPRESNL